MIWTSLSTKQPRFLQEEGPTCYMRKLPGEAVDCLRWCMPNRLPAHHVGSLRSTRVAPGIYGSGMLSSWRRSRRRTMRRRLSTYCIPPKVFQLAKVQNATQLWRVDRALYGFCRSPRLRGRFRDKRLRAAKIPFQEGYLYLKQHRADENIWSVCAVTKEGSMSVRAYINVYVDDILYVG